MRGIFSIQRIPAWLIYTFTLAFAAQTTLNYSLHLLLPEKTSGNESKLFFTQTGILAEFSCEMEEHKREIHRRPILTIRTNSNASIKTRVHKYEDCEHLNEAVINLDDRDFSFTKIRYGWYSNDVELIIGGHEFVSYAEFLNRYRTGTYVQLFFFLIACLVCFLKYKRIYYYKDLRL